MATWKRKSNSRRRASTNWSRCEHLEDRLQLASDFYVNDNWGEQTDNGVMPGVVEVGDIVQNTGAGDDGTVTGKTFGTDAFATVQSAVDAAIGGDTLHVLAGSYLESGQVTVDKSLTIIGAGQDVTVIQRAGSVSGTEHRTVQIDADNVTIQSLTLGGWEDAPLDANVGKGYLAWNAADHTTFDDVRFDADDNRVAIYTGTQDYLTVQDSRFTGSLFRAGIRGAGEHMLITGNSFEESHYWYSPIYFEYGGATSGEITYNYFANRVGVNNDVFGEFKSDGTGLYAITNFQPDTTTVDGLLIKHNTFDFQDSDLINDSGASPIPTGVYIDPLVPASGPITIVDNIFRGYEYTGPQPSSDPLWMPAGGMVDGAIEFDGTDDYGVFQSALMDIGSSGTIAFWINPEDVGGQRHSLVNGGGVEVTIRNGAIYFYPDSSEGSSLTYSALSSFGANTWTHVAVSWDFATQSTAIYFNGVEASYLSPYTPANSSWATPADTADKVIYLGNDPANSDRIYPGKLDDVGFFDAALLPAEIATVMSSGVSSFLGDSRLIADWTLDQSSGDVAVDAENGIELHLVTDGIVPFGPELRPGMGQFGGALEFDGVDDFATFQDSSFDVGEKGTLNFWVKMDDTGRRNEFFEGPGNGGFEVQYRTNSGGQVYSRATTDGDFVIRSGGDAATLDGNWTNVQIIYDFNGLPVADGEGSLRIFLNGVESGYLAGFTPTDLSWPGIVNTVDGLINVGRDPGDSSRHFDGLMDDIGWFDDVLTSVERDGVRTNGVADLSGDPRLVAHWDLDDAPGTMVLPGDTGTGISLYLQSEPPPPPIQGYAINATSATVVSNNLFYNNDVDFNAAVDDLGDNLNGDPLFVESGASTSEYYALYFGSPALDAATGAPTPNMVNIGAYQGASTISSVVTGTALSGAGQVALAWVPDPANMTTRVVRKVGSYPTDQDDGTTVYEGTDTSAIDDDGGSLAAGTYYYSFFATDGLSNYAVGTNAGTEGTIVAPSGLAPSLDPTSERSVGELAFSDSDKDGTIRAAEASGALEVAVFGTATSNENDTLSADLDSPISGTFTFETLVTMPSVVNQDWNLRLSLTDGGVTGIHFAFRYGYLFARTTGGWQAVASKLSASTSYKLTAIVDTTSGDVEIYWDEVQKLNLTTALSQVSQVDLRNMGYAAADVQYTIDDLRFISGTPGFYIPPVGGAGIDATDLNDNIMLGTSVRTFGSVSLDDPDADGTMQGSIDMGELSLDLAATAASGEDDSILATPDSSITGSFTFETEFTTPSLLNQDWNLEIGLEDGSGGEIRMAFRYRYLFLRNDADTSWSQIKSLLNPSTTYKLAVVVDNGSGLADYYIDDMLTARMDEPTSISGLSQIRFTNIGNAVVDLEYRIDNLQMTYAGFHAADLNDHIVLGTSDRTFSSILFDDPDADGTMQGSIDMGELSLDLAAAATSGENDSILATLESSITGTFTFETEFTTPSLLNQEWNLEIGLEDGSGGEIRMAFRFRYLFLRNDADTSWSPIKSLLDTSTAYKLSVVVDTGSGLADYYIDDMLTARTDELTSISGLSQIRFTNIGDATVDLEYRIDHLQVVTGDIFAPPPIIAPLTAPTIRGSLAVALPEQASDDANRSPRATLVAAALADEKDLLTHAASNRNDLADSTIEGDDSYTSYEQTTDELFTEIGCAIE